MNLLYSKNFMKLLLFLLILISEYNVNSQDPTVSLDMFLDLQNRVTTVEATQATVNGLFTQLNDRIQAQEDKEAQDINQLNGRITNLQGTVNGLNQEVGGLITALAETNNKVTAIEESVQEINGRLDKLENVNKIWRANFQVVNKTFAELRKKIKFIVPILRLPVYVVAG